MLQLQQKKTMTVQLSFESVKGLSEQILKQIKNQNFITLRITKQGCPTQLSHPLITHSRIFKKPYRYLCDHQGSIQLTLLIQNDGHHYQELATTTLSIPLILKMLINDPSHRIDYDIFLDSHQGRECYIPTKISYDPLKSFIGKSTTVESVSFRKDFSSDGVQFFKGLCKTNNLFSFLDFRAEKSEYHAIQKPYSDHKKANNHEQT